MKPSLTWRMSRVARASVLLALCIYGPSGAAEEVQVQDAWLRRNCLDGGTADRPLYGKAFETCLRKKIESLPPLDKNKRDHFGERYDPEQYVKCRLRPEGRNNSACDVFILRRREWPEYWPSSLPPIKWPSSVKRASYKAGMAPSEYWEHLCTEEAGEFVFKTISDVESVYLVRPRLIATDHELADRYVLEDPFGYTDVIATAKPQDYLVQPLAGHYRQLEVFDPDGKNFLRYFRSTTAAKKTFQSNSNGKWVRVPYVVEVESRKHLTARFGYTWRGISRVRDRDLAIAGGELGIIDLKTGEVVAIRRGFALTGGVRNSPTGIWWMSAKRCPAKKGVSSNHAFIERALKPVADINNDFR